MLTSTRASSVERKRDESIVVECAIMLHFARRFVIFASSKWSEDTWIGWVDRFANCYFAGYGDGRAYCDNNFVIMSSRWHRKEYQYDIVPKKKTLHSAKLNTVPHAITGTPAKFSDGPAIVSGCLPGVVPLRTAG